MAKPSKHKLKLLAKVRESLNSEIWSAHLSEKYNNRIYYHNKLTKTSTWIIPPDEDETSSKQTRKSCRKRSNTNSLLSAESQPISKLAKQYQSNSNLRNEQKRTISKAPVTYDSNNNESKTKITFKLKDAKNNNMVAKNNNMVAQNSTTPANRRLNQRAIPKINSAKRLNQKSIKNNCAVSTNKLHIKCKKPSNPKINKDLKTNLANSSKNLLYQNPLSEVNRSVPQTSADENSVVNELSTKTETEVEMMDVCITEEKQTQSSTNAVIFVVIDTNVLLNHASLEEIDSIVNWFPLPRGHFRRVIVVIPWIVLQELDGLKNAHVGKRARNAVTFLNNHFMMKKPGIRGQTIMEAAFVIDGLCIEVNDDRLLQCCFFFRQLPGKHFTILYSKDMNLCNKAMVNNLWTFSDIKHLYKGITNLCCDYSVMLDTQDAKFVQPKTTEATQVTENRILDLNQNNVEEQYQFEKEDLEDNEEVSSKVNEILRQSLSIILTREMVDTYGKELWQDVVLIKPPWTLLDVLKCIKKHWLAVFAMSGADKLNQDLMVQIHDYVWSNAHKLFNRNEQKSKTEKDFIYKSIQFVKGLCKGPKYTQAIKEYIQRLQKMHQNYGKSKDIGNIEIEVKKSSPKEIPTTIELSQETIKSHITNFWTVLDEVWMSIIKHCISIFNALQFSPSPERVIPPELIEGENRTFNPTPEMCISVLPLFIQLTGSLLQAIERFISTFTRLEEPPLERDCLDFLQTLWTTTQAFSLHTNIESIKPASLCRLNSSDDATKLHVGGKKLNSVYLILQECKTFVGQKIQ